jgi:hypothetical protein
MDAVFARAFERVSNVMDAIFLIGTTQDNGSSVRTFYYSIKSSRGPE